MNRERVEQLLRILDNIPPGEFNMGMFRQKTLCGTTMCLAGWAAVDPWFVERGLSWVEQPEGKPILMYRNFIYFPALRRFFEIGEQQCDELFSGPSDTTIGDMRGIVKRMLE